MTFRFYSEGARKPLKGSEQGIDIMCILKITLEPVIEANTGRKREIGETCQ